MTYVSGESFWSVTRVAQALSPAAVNLPRGDSSFSRVWTDTRTIQPGDLFVALVGERFDAHAFARDAVAAGAAGVVASRTESLARLGVPVFHVPDTLVALGTLGNYRRRAWGQPVIGVVGTNGKTSTKELVRGALGSRLAVHATAGNLNNLIGVPLTLLAIPDDAEVAVVEMGTNQPGEVGRLRAIVAPDVMIVTSIAEEHLEGLGDLAGVLREEMAGCDGVPLAIVPSAQPEVVEAAACRAHRVVTAGTDAGDVHPTRWGVQKGGEGWMDLEGVEVHIPLRGAHNVRNATLALAVAREFGIGAADAGHGIARIPVPPMRSNWEPVGRATVINDAYNSNPGSARAALELLRHAGEGRQRVAVLGTMLELGVRGPFLHDELARAAIEMPIELIAGIGEFATALDRVAGSDPRIVTSPDVESLWERLASRLAPDAVILLKGSRGVRLERLVPSIKSWAVAS